MRKEKNSDFSESCPNHFLERIGQDESDDDESRYVKLRDHIQ